MFFHRRPAHEETFSERLQRLRAAGFLVQSQTETQAVVRRDGCAAVVDQAPEGPRIVRAGLVVGGELAELVSLGYQSVWETPSGQREPARAAELARFHDFEQDLKYFLGLPSLFHESLGPQWRRHHYDRLAGRT